jgi:polar amino acid transport system permease protein
VARTDLEDAARDQRWRAPSLPADPTSFSVSAIVTGILCTAATWWVIQAIRAAMAASQIELLAADIALYVFGVGTLALFVPALKSVSASSKARQASAAGNIVEARVQTAAARTWCWYTYGYAAAVAIILMVALFVIANDVAVGRTFFYLPLVIEKFGLILRAFWINIYMFLFAEVLVLGWGLVIALARLLPGRPAQPVRLMATAYTDLFRALPAIITIYLVGFGLSLAEIPVVKDFSPEWFAILALTLTYGAYVAEVYRAGIESVHWSQTAAARSLGLSYLQTLRFVVVPQAVRRVIPPLLNDFISLQKDTALVNVIGVIDAFNQAKIIASNKFNLSPVSAVAFLFIVITIPQTRFVDRLIERERRRTQAGG